MRSASWVTAHGPRTTQPIGPLERGSVLGCASESCISYLGEVVVKLTATTSEGKATSASVLLDVDVAVKKK